MSISHPSFAVGVLAAALSLGRVTAQPAPVILRNGAPEGAVVEAPYTLKYAMDLQAGSWAWVRVDQHGVDVAITTYSPNGSKLNEFDSPNGAFGPEWVRLEASVQGQYRIEVQAIDETAPEGRVELRQVSSGTAPTTPEAAMDAYLARYNTTDSPGLAIRILRDGAPVYSKAFGMADLEHDIPITTSSVFQIASVSKQFTAFAALLLQREGLLSLDDDVRKFIPELPEYSHVVTIRHLAQHTSGLRDIDDLLALRGIAPNDEVTHAEAVALLLRQRGLNFVPGTAFEYSNSGYMLLAEVVARVSGKPFSDFLQERIFHPLGMKDTHVMDAPGTVIANRASAYGLEGAAYVERPVNGALMGSTGVNSTVEDLCRWAMNFKDPVVGDREMLDNMERSGKLVTNEPFTYGIGLDRKEYRGQQVVFHGGGLAGYRSYLVRVPAHDLVIAITANAEDFNPIETAEKAIDLFLEDEISASEVAQATMMRPSRKRDGSDRPTDLDALVGDYELFPGLVFTVKRNGPGLVTNVLGSGDVQALEELDANTFQLNNRYNRWVFSLGANGRAQGFAYHLYDFTWQAKRIALKPLDVARIRPEEFIGTYVSEELGVALVVVQEDSALVVRGHRWGDAVMKPFQPDAFTTDQARMGLVAFTRDAQGEVTKCLVSGQRARDIVFERVR
ncbi:MAG: beta-lactamase family protein [Flavobacteriales bacterium]|nr:beta-lactamase family protein [Flavobacteriales bacterium]